MTVLVSDSFNRADSTTSLGTTDSYNGGTATAWQIYHSATGTPTYGISSNQGYMVSSGNNANQSFAGIDVALSDVKVTTTFSVNASGANTLILRASSPTSFLMFQNKSSNYVLYYYNGSTWTTLGTWAKTPASGDVIQATLSGSSITITINGANSQTITSSQNQTATIFGFAANTSVIARFDNFQIEDLNTGGGGTTLTVSLSDSVTLSELLMKSPSKRLSDSLTIGEVFSKQGNLNKSDSITLSDNLSKSLTVTVMDTVSMGDSSTASQGGKSASLSDTVIVTDAIVKKVISTYKNDAVNLSDVDNHTATKQLLDSIASLDSITVSNGKSIILSDTITVTDAIFKAVSVMKSDSITLADSTSKTAKIGVYDVLITSDDLSILNPQAPAIIGTIHLKGSAILNVYLVGSQTLNVNLKGGI